MPQKELAHLYIFTPAQTQLAHIAITTMAKKAGTPVLGKLKYAPITNQVGAYTKAQIKAYWKTEKAKKRAELDEANEKAQIAAMAKHPHLWSKPMKPRVMRKHNDIIAQKEKKSAKVSTL